MAYIEAAFELVELKPGEIHVAKEPTLITTLLGSCVSVCLFSGRDMIGAMSHSVLPSPPYGHCKNDVRYVECALERMLDEMSYMGIPAGRLEAKLFGGAEMFQSGSDEVRLARIIGDSNIEAARSFLESEGVNVLSECVGGNTGRKLIFNTATGVVLVRRVVHGLPKLKSTAGKM